MKITDFVERQAKLLDESSRRIKDFRVFDFNYIPEHPVMRDEVKPIVSACLRYLKTGIANHLFIFGSRGSGKTLMIRYIQRLLAEQSDADQLYVNCRQHNTSFKVLAHLLEVRPRGWSLDELWHRFTERFSRRLVLVLDEADLLSDKDRQKDLLYLLARSTNSYMMVLLSNRPQFLDRLDESIRSSLQPEKIHFRNYDATEVLRILRDRAELGLGQCPEPHLPEIAALTVRTTNSDVRVAIKTLYHLALEPTLDVRSVFERARRDLVQDVLTGLADSNLVILKAIAESRELFVKAIYERYRRISIAVGTEPFSYVHFYASLSYLQSTGLVLLVSTKVGRAYTNQLQLLFDHELLDSTWNARFA